MFMIFKPDASLSCDGYSGRLPRNPWLVCGCCIQWDPEVRPETRKQGKKNIAFSVRNAVMIRKNGSVTKDKTK